MDAVQGCLIDLKTLGVDVGSAEVYTKLARYPVCIHRRLAVP
jgi:hypothetical protein